ncbi:TPA: tail fiber assembly protein [Escherichia coli]|uniref:Caudovirales tail fiber assembly family protein n=1 Tax=Escherichia coli 1-250-04_S3_C1 TaxID=1444135 RepID=A0AAN4NMS7_ECOLX|nr:tail fiber assembly protein [Escherichia coli]EJV4780962.1 tail fiber assembly protein [Shigella dysenteriae]ELU5591311.1 tail fiber assembly protein [Escherichia coli]EZJ78432.1 caudovirales tail fiber assembly family protein [Escherichia coli 1-250-04_S3_C1]EZJ78566.1 caudovirales tail fiber assembly family protein [Escherichia coli 1-250-04_S3_C1]EZJ78757.1 caudovirales tail fiber assembly family protein [Escherichia coli 1-250-04_S3_C1]
MNRFAIIEKGIVINVVSANSPTDLNYPASDVIDIGNMSIECGYVFSDDGFSAPPKTKDEEIAAAYQLKMRLTSTAREIISTLQADLLLGEISDDDKARLIEWRAYLRLLEAINIQDAPGINWPNQP